MSCHVGHVEYPCIIASPTYFLIMTHGNLIHHTQSFIKNTKHSLGDLACSIEPGVPEKNSKIKAINL